MDFRSIGIVSTADTRTIGTALGRHRAARDVDNASMCWRPVLCVAAANACPFFATGCRHGAAIDINPPAINASTARVGKHVGV